MARDHFITPQSRAWNTAPPLVASDRASHLAYWLGMGVILVVALALRVWDLNATDMWSDEMHTLLRVRLPLGKALDTLLYAGNQTPLYYLLLRVLPGESLAFIRGVSVILGMVNVVLLGEIVRRLYGNPLLGLALGMLLAVHPMHVVLSRTARYYTLLMAVALVVTWSFLLLVRGRRSHTVWGVFWIGSAALYLLHYSALALPATQLAFLLLHRHRYRDLLRVWAPLQIIAVLPLVAWYGILLLYWFTPYLNGPQEFSYSYLGQNLAEYDIAISAFNILLGFGGKWDWLVLPGLLAGAAGLAAGLRDAVDSWRQGGTRWYWALLGVVTLVVLFVMAWFYGGQYRDRYYIISMAGVLIMFGLGVRQWARPVALATLALVIGTSAYITLDMLAARAYERSDWSGVADYLEAHFQPGDRVIVSRELLYEVLDEYVDDPAIMAATVMLDEYVGMRDNDEIVQTEPDGRRVWVIYRMRHEDFHLQAWEKSDPLTPDLSPISNWLLAREERIRDRVPFNGIELFLVDGVDR